MKRIVVIILLLSLLTACSAAPATEPAAPERTLTVFAASSLTGAFSEIGSRFEADNPGVIVTFNFAGSQTLRSQIEQGAEADVFASANMKEMNTLVITSTLVAEDSPQVFLTNHLLVILPAGNPAAIETLEDLSRPGIKLVLAAEDVPVGRYARQALEQLEDLYGEGYRDAVLSNVVSNEDNVKQVVTKVELGEADAGIVYVSDAVAAPDLERLEIPAEYNVVAEYPIATLTGAPEPDLASAFIAFVLSPEGQSILETWGFIPVQE